MTAGILVADEAVGRLAELGDEGFHVELSLADRIDDGRITSWAERIILPVFPRDEIRLADGLASSPDSAGDRGIVVEVSRL